jgi:hypothetical protein
MIGDVSVAKRVTASGVGVFGMVVGSSYSGDGFTTGSPAALWYESNDLKNWCVRHCQWFSVWQWGSIIA